MSGYDRYNDTDANCGPLRVFIAILRIPLTIMFAAFITASGFMMAVVVPGVLFAVCIPMFLLQVLTVPFFFVLCKLDEANGYAKRITGGGIMEMPLKMGNDMCKEWGKSWSWLAKFASADPNWTGF